MGSCPTAATKYDDKWVHYYIQSLFIYNIHFIHRKHNTVDSHHATTRTREKKTIKLAVRKLRIKSSNVWSSQLYMNFLYISTSEWRNNDWQHNDLYQTLAAVFQGRCCGKSDQIEVQVSLSLLPRMTPCLCHRQDDQKIHWTHHHVHRCYRCIILCYVGLYGKSASCMWPYYPATWLWPS